MVWIQVAKDKKPFFYREFLVIEILIPNFTNNVSERLALLDELIGQSTTKWILIGSSLGGLTATLYAIRHPEKVAKMILIAPALVPPYTHKYGLKPIKDIPVILYHGKDNELLSVEEVRKVAEKLFPLLDYHLVDDDHRHGSRDTDIGLGINSIFIINTNDFATALRTKGFLVVLLIKYFKKFGQYLHD